MAIHIWRHERLSGGPARLEAMFGQMAETFKCPHCGAMYEITPEKSVSHDEKDATDCQVCGKQMELTKSSRIRGYALVKMPDGTSV
jgi:transcription initiation factor IIE alpha subunit